MALMADYHDRMIVNSILLVLDGTPSSVQAGRTAVGFAQEHVSKLVILAFGKGEAAGGDIRDSAYLVGEWAQHAGVPCEMSVLRGASCAEDIMAEARRRHCDLVWLPAPAEEGDASACFDARTAIEVLGKAHVPVMLYRKRAA